jgi:xylulokinase
MNYLLGLCVGTSGIKALITDTSGKIIDTSTVEYGVISPRPGWTEQNPDLWLESSIEAIKDLVGKSNSIFR